MTTRRHSVTVLGLVGLISMLSLGGLTGCSRELKVGAVLPLSGDDAPYGQALERGMRLAIEELESRETPPGLTLEIADSHSEADRAAQLTRGFCGESPAIVGGVTGAELAAMVPEVAKCGALMLSVGTSGEWNDGGAEDVRLYRLVPDTEVEAASIARFVRESLDLETMAIVAEASPFGEGFVDELDERFPGTVVVLRFSTEERDLSGIVAQLREGRLPAVFVAAEGHGLVRAIQAVRAAGFGGWQRPILSSSTLASAALLEEMGESSNGVVFTQTRFDPLEETEPLQSFVDRYRARYGELPDHYAARGYDVIGVLATALEEGGGPSAAELEKGMRGLTDFAGATGPVQFRESGEVQRFPRVYAILEGTAVDYREQLQARRERLLEKLRRFRASTRGDGQT